MEGKGTVCGVQLHAAKGKNNGTVGGNRYFECPKGYGVLVKPDLVDVDVNTYTDFDVRTLSDKDAMLPLTSKTVQASQQPAIDHGVRACLVA